MFSVVHVAGTNGKGSTAALIAAALRSAGNSVGLYTSPHLVDLRERVLVNGEPITCDAFAQWTARLEPTIERTGASFFEAYTAIAFADFAARGVDIAVVEAGLGGRLDATNIVSPVVSVVTGIGMDHTEYLGETLKEIAIEKAHVSKEGRPFIIGEAEQSLVEELCRVGLGRGAVPVVVEAGCQYEGELLLVGQHQRRNAAVARVALQHLGDRWNVTDSDITDGFADVRVAGRFDIRGKWIFDIAHNRQAMTALLETLKTVELVRPFHVLVAILRDKDHRQLVADLSAVADAVWVTVAPSAPGARTVSLDGVDFGLPSVTCDSDFDAALRSAEDRAGTILVTGSAYTVGDAMDRLPGLSPLG